MSEQGSRPVIDSLEFARSGQSLRGSLPVISLTRLHDSLFDTAGAVAFAVQGGCDVRQRPTLALEVTGELHLCCQRCLGRLDYPLRFANTLLLESVPAAGAVDVEEVEAVEPSAEFDIAELIEDEIILELPYAPRHAEGECRPGRDLSGPPGERSAFAKLAELKRDSK
jgi:uncharacterized protein